MAGGAFGIRRVADPAGGPPPTAPWPGLDEVFYRTAAAASRSTGGRAFRASLARDLARARGKISPLGPPVAVLPDVAANLHQVARSYVRCVHAVVAAWFEYPEIRRVVTLPEGLADLVADPAARGGDRIHLCRIDTLLQRDGTFKIIETNANCPGGLLSTGRASRKWRVFLGSTQRSVPAPLPHETPQWMARWYLKTAQAETGERPDFMVLLREKGGNRLELPGLAEEFAALGVHAIEADPRELRDTGSGTLAVRGISVRHAYWKLGLRELEILRPNLKAVLEALGRGDLFVQNGLAGRLIGDNKLCLAVVSDPYFTALFDPVDLAVVRPHVPWSRNAALCSRGELRTVRERPMSYVLKRPLDTRGRGVVVGLGSPSHQEWLGSVDKAVKEGWLVQSFCATSGLGGGDQRENHRRHDLSVGMAGGEPVAAQSRSSDGYRTNVALSGCLHPAFAGVVTSH